MRLVIIESPFAGEVERNIAYARRCMRDSLIRGEAPFASHLLYTQYGVLDDAVQRERELGMEAGYEWMDAAWLSHRGLVAVYEDYGISSGMSTGIARARVLGIEITFRQIGKNNAPR